MQNMIPILYCLTSPICLSSVKVKCKIQQSFCELLTFLTVSCTLFVSLLLLPIRLFFLVLYWRRLEAQDEEIQMPSLKPSESKNRSQRRFFYTAPQSSSVRSSIYPGSTCNSVYVCVHGRMGTCKARALQRTPPACQWCWQVSGSSSKGCPRSACLEALLWQEAQVIKGGRLRGDDGGW